MSYNLNLCLVWRSKSQQIESMASGLCLGVPTVNVHCVHYSYLQHRVCAEVLTIVEAWFLPLALGNVGVVFSCCCFCCHHHCCCCISTTGGECSPSPSLKRETGIPDWLCVFCERNVVISLATNLLHQYSNGRHVSMCVVVLGIALPKPIQKIMYVCSLDTIYSAMIQFPANTWHNDNNGLLLLNSFFQIQTFSVRFSIWHMVNAVTGHDPPPSMNQIHTASVWLFCKNKEQIRWQSRLRLGKG